MIVMVVEDSSAMRQLVCHALKRIEGVVLVEATDGANALEKLAEIRPDIIVTDLNMPIMDGHTLIERVRATDGLATVPIIVLTTEGALQDQQRAGALHVSAFVTKPIRQDDLVDAVKRVAAEHA
jgi:two-component system chemotaxis response regulator CheY